MDNVTHGNKYNHLSEVALTLGQFIRPLVVLVSEVKSSDTVRSLLGRKPIRLISKFILNKCMVLEREITFNLC